MNSHGMVSHVLRDSAGCALCSPALWGCWSLLELPWFDHTYLRHPAGFEWMFLHLRCQAMSKTQLTNGVQLKLELWCFSYANVETECCLSTWCKFFRLFRCGFRIVEHAIRNMLVLIIHLLLLSQQFSPPGCLHPC